MHECAGGCVVLTDDCSVGKAFSGSYRSSKSPHFTAEERGWKSHTEECSQDFTSYDIRCVPLGFSSHFSVGSEASPEQSLGKGASACLAEGGGGHGPLPGINSRLISLPALVIK